MHDGASRPSSNNGENENAVITVRAALQDIAFGSAAGMISEVFEYPFDLTKVRLQSQLLSPPLDGKPRFQGPMDCLMQTWRDEGFRGLYRGLPVPLAGSMAETAALFVAYSSLQNIIHRYYGTTGNLTIPQLCFAAAGAGAATSFILTPIELVKCKLQVQMMNTTTPARIPPIHVSPKLLERSSPLDSSIYTPHPSKRAALPSPPQISHNLPGPFSIIRTVIQTNGIRGLWLGHTGTILRETGGTAAWFAVKEWIGRVLRNRRVPNHSSSEPIPLLPWESATAGAISGAFCVAALYPADTVKSAMQTEEELRSHRAHTSSAAREWAVSNRAELRAPTNDPNAALKKISPAPLPVPSAVVHPPTVPKVVTDSFLQTFLKIHRTHGLRGLYAGCGMSMARAVPSSGIVFVVYDGLTAYFA